MKRKREMRRARQRCVTCSPSVWRAIQELARAAGMKTSPYILARVLGGESPMALSAEHQRNLYERVNRLVLLCEDLLRPLPGCGVTLHEAVSFLYRDRRSADEAAMARTRRSAPGRSGAGHGARAPDLFDEEALP